MCNCMDRTGSTLGWDLMLALAGATSSAVMQAASSVPIAGLHPDRWRTNPIADEVQAASSRSGSFSNQVCNSLHIGPMLTPSRLHSPEHQEIFNSVQGPAFWRPSSLCEDCSSRLRVMRRLSGCRWVQDAARPELNAENAAYAREVAELFASSRRGIDRSTNSSFSSAGVRTPSGGSGHGHPPARAGAPGAQPAQACPLPQALALYVDLQARCRRLHG